MDNYKQVKDQYFQMYSGIRAAAEATQTPASATQASGLNKAGWYSGDRPTWREAVGKAYEISRTDPVKGNELWADLQTLRSDPSSMFYNAYSQPTSYAVKNLAALGFNTNQLNDNFFGSQEYQTFMAENLERSETTGNVKSPTKKSSVNNQIAYYLDKAYDDYQRTKTAKDEYQSIIKEAMFMAGNSGWNYSDDYIIKQLRGVDQNGEIDNHNLKQKYPTLYKMMGSGADPLGLTEAVDFSDDALTAVMWAARNPDQKVNSIEQAMAYSYLGKGNSYKENPEITAKLEPLNPDGTINADYHPYSVGSTIAYEDALFFGIYGADDQWLEENKRIKYYGTDEEKKHYDNIEESVNNQHAVDNAEQTVYDYVNFLFKSNKNPQEIQDALDVALAGGKLYVKTDKNVDARYYTKPGTGREEVDLGILNRIDASVGKNIGKETQIDPNAKLVPLSVGTTYKYDNLIQQINDTYNAYNKPAENDTLAGLNPDQARDENREKKPFELMEESANKKASDAMFILDDQFSDSERKYFKSLPKPNGYKLAEAFYNVKQGLWANGEEITGPYDMKTLTDPEWVVKMATRQAEKADQDYMSISMNSLEMRTNYEALRKETDDISAELQKIEGKFGDVMLAQEETPEVVKMNLDDFGGFEVEYRLGTDGKYHYVSDNESAKFADLVSTMDYSYNVIDINKLKKTIEEKEQHLNDTNETVQNAKARLYGESRIMTIEDEYGNALDVPFVYDKESRRYVLSPTFNSESEEVERYLETTGDSREYLFSEIKNYTKTLNDEIANGPEIDPDAPDEHTINALRAQLDTNLKKLEKGKDQYDKAVAEVEKANARRNRIGDLTLRNSGLSVDPAISDKKLEYISGFTNFEVPEDGYFWEDGKYTSFMDSLRDKYLFNSFGQADADEIRAYADELNEQVKDIRFLLDGNENIPKYYKEKMEECAGWYESRARLYENFIFSKGKDFERLAREGEEQILNEEAMAASDVHSAYDQGIPKPGWMQMTDYEKDMYYALYKRDGREAADQFYSDIERSLITRANTAIDLAVQENAESGILGRAFNELVSIGLAPVEVALNEMYLVQSALTGEGSPWLRVPSNAAKKANEATIQQLHNIYEGTVWDEIFPSMVEMINNRGRSYAVGGIFGGLLPEIAGGSGFLTWDDIVHSFPIATIAFGEAYEDAINNGMEQWQAWTLGFTNFLCESVTEGIKFGNYKSLFEGGVTLQSFKDYFLDKIKGLDWLEEAVGETLNNILERSFNRWVAGDKGDHEKRIQAYIESGLVSSEEEAEIMVMLDYIKEDEHTAIISALSSFMDVGVFGLQKIGETVHYANEAARYNRNHEDSVTIRDLRNRDTQLYNNARELQQKADEIRRLRQEKAAEPFVPKNPASVEEAQQQSNQTEYDVDITILENSADSDQATITETIAAVLRVSNDNANRANAAAVTFADRFGEDAIGSLQDMLDAGRKSGTNINTLKLGIQYSLLADGECRQVMNSEEYQNAAPEQQAAMLSAATQADAKNQSVQAAVNETVHESRVAEAAKDLMGENEAFELNALQENANEAAMNTYIAQQELDDKLKARKEASDNVTSVTMDFLADPSDENAKRKDQAEHELAAADAVVKEYEQHYENMRTKQTNADNALEQTKSDVMTRIRQQAEERVSQQEQAEAASAVKAEAEAQVRAEQEAQQRIAKRESDNAGVADREAFVEQWAADHPGTTEEDKEQIRRLFDEERASNAESVPAVRDENGNLTPEAKVFRDKVMKPVSKKFHIEIAYTDTKAERGTRSDGYFDEANNRIVLDNNVSADEALYFVLAHELTNTSEDSAMYKDIANTLLKMAYGPDADFDEAIANLKNNGGNPATRLEADLLENLKSNYEKQYGDAGYEYAMKEMVSNYITNMFSQQDDAARQELIDRLVNEDPGIANGIFDSIKGFLKKVKGIEGESIANIQKTADALETALKNVQGTTLPLLKKVSEAIKEKIQYIADQSPFAKEYKAWNRKKDSTALLTIGKPSDLLKSYGVPDADIKISGGKIIDIKNTHPAMTDNVIRQIPSILENPVLIMKSQTRENDTITMFGELVDKNGYPVLAAVAITPTLDEKTGIEFVVFRSAYGKDKNPQNFIDNSEILYQDETRAGAWAATMGLQLPSGHTQTDSSEEMLTQPESSVKYSLPSEDIVRNKIRQYIENGGSIPHNAQPSMLVGPAPNNNNQGNYGMSKFAAETAQKSSLLANEAKEHLIANGEYLKDANNEQLDRALSWIASHASETDASGFYSALSEAQSPDFNTMTPDGQARLVALMAMATSIKDEKQSIEMQKQISQLYRESGTNAAQTLQARRLFNLMTPMGRQATLLSLQDKINQQFADKGSNTRVNLSDEVLKAAAEAKTAEEFETVQKMARKEINEQTPVNWKERLLAFRYFAMLCAPTTHVRNFAGNGMFVPLVSTKNKVGAAIELIDQARGKIDKSERTKSLRPIAPKKLRDFARTKAKEQQDVLTGQAKYKDGDKLKQERKVFGTKDDPFSKTVGKALQKAYDAVGTALEWMDWQFLKGHYRRAMSGLMMARGLSPEDMKGQTWNDANAYAIEEAKKATYRDASAIADVLGNLRKAYKGDDPKAQFGLNVLQMLLDARFPFKTTPINIAKRGIEYSPVGIAKTLAYDRKHLKQYLDAKDGKLKSMPKTAISPTQFIDKLASGLTGVGTAALGFVLARNGILRCGFDPEDPEDKLAKERGDQEYSIKLGKLGNDAVTAVGRLFDKDFKCEIFDEDVTTSLDWAAPVNMSIFFGAALENQIDDIDDDGTVFQKLAKAFTDITEPMYELSMMSNVKEMFNTNAYDDTDPVTQFLIDTILDYAGSFVPNLIPKISNIVDETSRTSYVPAGDKFPQWTLFREQMENKFWFLRQDNIPYRDAYGNTNEHVIPAAVENLLSPAKVTRVEHGIYDELERLLKDTKSNPNVSQSDRGKLVMSNPDKTLKVGKETIKLTDKQFDQIKEERGTLATSLLEELFNTEEYKRASDETKVNMVTDVYAYATKVAKHHLDNRVELNDSSHNWIENAYTNNNPIEEVIESNVSKNRKTYVKDYSTELAKSVEVGSDENIEMSKVYLEQAKATESEIRDGVSDYFRPKYYAAYRSYLLAYQDGDEQAMYEAEETMEEIQDKMYDLDIGYDKKTFSTWERSVRKKIGYTEDDENQEEDEDEMDWLNP